MVEFCFCWDACFVFGQYDVCEGNAIIRTFCLFLLLSISSNINNHLVSVHVLFSTLLEEMM